MINKRDSFKSGFGTLPSEDKKKTKNILVNGLACSGQ